MTLDDALAIVEAEFDDLEEWFPPECEGVTYGPLKYRGTCADARRAALEWVRAMFLTGHGVQ